MGKSVELPVPKPKDKEAPAGKSGDHTSKELAGMDETSPKGKGTRRQSRDEGGRHRGNRQEGKNKKRGDPDHRDVGDLVAASIANMDSGRSQGHHYDHGRDRGPQDAGKAPNPRWRTLTVAELRWQGRYRALIPPEDVALGPGEASYRALRKDADLYRQLSQGVLTGDHINGVLGVCEPHAAQILQTPWYMHGHGPALAAFAHLSEPRITHESTMVPDGSGPYTDEAAAQRNGMLVLKFNSGCAPYTAMKEKPPPQPSLKVANAPKGMRDLMAQWNAAQQPAVLYALTQHFTHGIIEECGLEIAPPLPAALGGKANSKAGSGLSVSTSKKARADDEGDALPALGATPVARLRTTRNRDAKVETVTTAAVCPFVWNKHENQFLREHPPPHDSIPPWVMPRLQYELLVEDLQWGNFCSASTTRGMHIFRVQRNDAYIKQLLAIVQEFHSAVKAGEPPKEDFFWDRKQYRAFLDATCKLCNKVQSPEVVQSMRRPSGREPFFLDKDLPAGERDDDDDSPATAASSSSSKSNAGQQQQQLAMMKQQQDQMVMMQRQQMQQQQMAQMAQMQQQQRQQQQQQQQMAQMAAMQQQQQMAAMQQPQMAAMQQPQMAAMQQPQMGSSPGVSVDPQMIQMYMAMGYAVPPEMLQAAQQQQEQQQQQQQQNLPSFLQPSAAEAQPAALPSNAFSIGADGLPTAPPAAPANTTSSVRYVIGPDGLPQAVPAAAPPAAAPPPAAPPPATPSNPHLGAAPLEAPQQQQDHDGFQMSRSQQDFSEREAAMLELRRRAEAARSQEQETAAAAPAGPMSIPSNPAVESAWQNNPAMRYDNNGLLRPDVFGSSPSFDTAGLQSGSASSLDGLGGGSIGGAFGGAFGIGTFGGPIEDFPQATCGDDTNADDDLVDDSLLEEAMLGGLDLGDDCTSPT